MPVTCRNVMAALDELAPARLAAEWDNTGLLVGSPAQTVNRVLVTLDVTWEAAEKARMVEKTMIVSHHPVIFKAISSIRTDLPQGKLLAAIIKNDLAVYAAHTNMDIAPGGINDILAEKLGVLRTEPLAENFCEKLYKIVVFVPEKPANHLEEVRAAMSGAGAGHIGNYRGCTFDMAGTGTFCPLEGASPYIGQTGRLEYVPERRLETIVPESLLRKVITAMLQAHPYEEVAYDVFLLQNGGRKYGLGRVGDLAEPLSLNEFLTRVKVALGINHVGVAGAAGQTVKRAAVCGGSGAGLAAAAAALGADVFVTGDVKYHEAQAAADSGLVIVDAGHFATENIFVPFVAGYLQKYAAVNNWDIKVEGLNLENVLKIY